MKGKASVPANVPQRHIYSRISYLHQAACYLTLRHSKHENLYTLGESAIERSDVKIKDRGATTDSFKGTQVPVGDALSRLLLSHVRGVSLKGQTRMSATLKHSICRRCDSPLVAGVSSSSYVENKSTGGEKAWADVLVIFCNLCDARRRFPIGATRQSSKAVRQNPESGALVDSISRCPAS